jgi:hypothetical protein
MFSSDTLHNIIVFIYRYGNSMICILGNIGNVLSAMVFFQKSWSKNVCVFYFKVYLVISSIYLNSTILGFTLLIGFNINVQHSNAILCKMFFYFLPGFISTFLPTVLILGSIDRLLISSQNVNTRLYNSKCLAYIFISSTLLFWLPFNSHILMKIHIQKIGSSAVRCWYDFTIHHDYVYYSLMINDLIFLFIIFILCIVSFKNVYRIRTVSREQRNRIQLITMKDLQVLRCLFIYNIIFIMSSICSAVYSIYNEVTNDKIRTSSEQAIRSFLTDLFTFIGFSFYSVIFFVFFIVSKGFRRKLKQLFGKCFRKKNPNRQNNVQRQTLATMTTIV